MAMGDWSELSFDMLYEIVMRFETIEDFVYFSVVCRLWNQFATTVKHKFNAKTTPWLLLAENTKDNPDCLRKVFNPFNQKYYSLKLPETFGCRCWGSAYGWLVTYNKDLDLHLLNPLTKVRISLPPIARLPYLWGRYYPYPLGNSLNSMRYFLIRKAFVLKVGEDDFVVFLSYYFGWKKFAFARPGDQSWTTIDHLGPTIERVGQMSERLNNFVAEVICRGSRILILYEDTSIGYLDISNLSDPQKLVVKENYKPIPVMILSDSRNLCIKTREYVSALPKILDGFDIREFGSYLVDSNGDVFMVLRDRCEVEEDEYTCATFKFKVYRLDFDKKKWSQVDSLGGGVVFVGNTSSMSVPAVKAQNCESNCIYYTDDNDAFACETPTIRGDDMGFFDLADGTKNFLEENCYTTSNVQTPLWFMPRF